ncbi:methyltransferase [Streptomyces sp. NPDC059076]|uniref:methyltransferase n=1 Tax=unclassified Streptomyces TaxID=2593676 RepID=UPI0036A0D9F0
MTIEEPLAQLSFGYIPAQILYTATELGLADALADGPLDHRDAAERTGADPVAALRLLRALVGLGVVAQLDAERFELTASGRQLITGTPGSLRDDILLSAMPELWRAWGDLPQVLRSGQPPRNPVTGLTAHEALMRDPQLAEKFRAAKVLGNQVLTAGVTAAYDFSRFRTVADLSGDEATLLTAVLTAVPGLRGVVQDGPEALERAAAALAGAGVADRADVREGDVLDSAPPGADVYLLAHVLREWDDDQATAILRNCRAAMAPGGRVVIVETVVPAVLTPEDSATYGMTDLNNLVYAGGRERTAEEFRALLSGAGFTLTAQTSMKLEPGMPDYHLIEGTPGV